MLLIGIVKMDFPTDTSIPSTIAIVSGILSVVHVPCPMALEIVTMPPTFSTFFFTTSMPTPLPEYSVTSSFVENPGIIRRFNISLWLYSLSGFVRRPLRCALAKTEAGFMPWPSSSMEIITSLPVCSALSIILALAAFPASSLSCTFSSMP